MLCLLLLFLFVLVVVDGCGSYHGNPQPSFLGLLSPIFLGFKTYMFHGFLGSCCVVVWSPSCKRGQLRGGLASHHFSYVRSGLNSHYFHIIGDGHQPNSRGLYTHYEDSY